MSNQRHAEIRYVHEFDCYCFQWATENMPGIAFWYTNSEEQARQWHLNFRRDRDAWTYWHQAVHNSNYEPETAWYALAQEPTSHDR
jgi:hypothetical protein